MAGSVDKRTSTVVRDAWESLVSSRESGHWLDAESDRGFLKDVEAHLALVEPFLMAVRDFVDPPLAVPDLVESVIETLQTVRTVERDTAIKPGSFNGFSASPYPYVPLDVDYVDSAAAVLDLCRLTLELSAACRHPLVDSHRVRLEQVGQTALRFLVASRIEDNEGCRWAAVFDVEGARLANMFHTRYAFRAINHALRCEALVAAIDEPARREAKAVLPLVARWTIGQFDRQRAMFYYDADRASMPAIAGIHALDILYSSEDPSDEQLKYCRAAVAQFLSRCSSLDDAQRMQIDVFARYRLPSLAQAAAYDDRGYVGDLLSVLAKAKQADPEVLSPEFIGAAELLFEALRSEWIDGPTKMWDDGRPLICYTHQALVALVNHSLYGSVEEVTLREDELRAAVRDALDQSNLVDEIVQQIVSQTRARQSRSITLAASATNPPNR